MRRPPKHRRKKWYKRKYASYENVSCTGKRRYLTSEEAAAGLELIKQLNAGSNLHSKKNKNLHVYECPLCGGWHVGHKPWEKKDDARGSRCDGENA